MKQNFRLVLSALLIACMSPLAAEWEPRGMCYVWKGDTPPKEAPEGMLKGEIYDYNRNPQGEFFTYSGIYSNDKSSAPGRSLKAALKERSTGARNPTGSPDVHGQFAYTLRELMNGRYGILKKYYKYPFTIATPHIYMAPIRFTSLADALDAGQEGEDSDFLTESDAFQKKTGRAKSFNDHVSWFAIFRGTVIAPRSMKFRFYGAADDSIAVRFNEKLVLETGYCKPALYQGNGIRDKGCN